MQPIRSFLDRIEPLFLKGGRFEQLHALYEAVDTFFYSPADIARGSPHVRDALDLKRVMILVMFASAPAAVVGMWNVGFQANSALASMGLVGIEGWRGVLLPLLGAGYDPASLAGRAGAAVGYSRGQAGAVAVEYPPGEMAGGALGSLDVLPLRYNDYVLFSTVTLRQPSGPRTSSTVGQ